MQHEDYLSNFARAGNRARLRIWSASFLGSARVEVVIRLAHPLPRRIWNPRNWNLLLRVRQAESGHFVLCSTIIQPLGMKQSGYDHPANILPHRAAGYSRLGTNIINCIPFAMDTPHAAGALYSTVGDMLIWDGALYSDRLVSARTLETMFTPFKHDYCCGWFHGDFSDHIGYGHAGGISGFATQVIRLPNERVYIVVLSNFDWARSSDIAKELSLLFFNTKQ